MKQLPAIAMIMLAICHVTAAAAPRTGTPEQTGPRPATATVPQQIGNATDRVGPVNRKEITQPEYVIDYVPPYIALAAKIGTLGPGLEATIGIIEGLNIRAGGNFFRVRHGGSIRDVHYDFDVKLASVPVLADWHPFKNEFRISGGIVYNRNMADLDSTPDRVTRIGDHDYTPEEIGELSGSVRFNSLAPYIGLGFGNAVLDEDKSWGFVFDIGIMFQGSPDVSLSAKGTMAENPAFKQDLGITESDIQDDADYFRIYPVLSFGISYQF